MKKKNIIILIILLILLCICGIRSIRDNYQFGQELDYHIERLSWQYADFVESIDRLKGAVEKGDNSYSFLSTYYNELYDVTHYMGSDDIPLLDDVGHEWYLQFDKLFNDAVRGDEHVRSIFADEEKFKELAHLRDQLNHMVDCFREFRENYEQMSVWDRYFTSWKDEQKILNEKVRFSPLSE